MNVQAGISRCAEYAAIWSYNIPDRLWSFGRRLSQKSWVATVKEFVNVKTFT